MTDKIQTNRYKTTFGTAVELLLPAYPVGTADHDQNLIVKIKYGKHSILLTGDASKKLIESVAPPRTIPLNNFNFAKIQQETKMSDPSPMEDVSVLLLSHHGSNAGEELVALWKSMFRYHGTQPWATIISSNPAVKDNIPKTSSLKLLIYPKEALIDYFCMPHTVRASYTVEIPKTLDIPAKIDHDITLPVFCTANTKIGYAVKLAQVSPNPESVAVDEIQESYYIIQSSASTLLTSSMSAISNGHLYMYPEIKKESEIQKEEETLPPISTSHSVKMPKYESLFSAVSQAEMKELEEKYKQKQQQIKDQEGHVAVTVTSLYQLRNSNTLGLFSSLTKQ
jgi:hypothetical protein